MNLPEILGPSPGSVEARTSLALKVLAGLGFWAVVLSMIPPPYPMSWLQAVTFNAATAVMVMLYLVEAVGLDRRWPWAYAAARPLLALIGVTGLYLLGAEVAAGRFRLPFDVVLAAWAWLGTADTRGAPRRDRRTVALVGASLVLLTVPLTGASVFGWGGLLDVHEPDLRATLESDCDAHGDGPPGTVSVTYEWSWRTSGLFPSGDDVVVISWTGDDRFGRPLYFLGDTAPPGTGVVSGRQVDPSAAMAREIEAEKRGSWHWGIELEAQRLEPGRIEFQLDLARPAPPQPGPLTIAATYIHLGLWRQDAAGLTCSW